MDSKHRAYTLVAIAVVLAAGWGATQIIEANKQTKLEEIKAALARDNEAEKTRQLALVARAVSTNPVVEKFAQASEKGAKALVEAAPDAKSIRIGRVEINKDEIDEMNQRAARDRASASILSEPLQVVRVEPKDGGVTRFVLRRKDDSEFTATLSDDELEADEVQRIWDAARSRRPITLQVNATVIRGAIRSATILGVMPENPTVARQ